MDDKQLFDSYQTYRLSGAGTNTGKKPSGGPPPGRGCVTLLIVAAGIVVGLVAAQPW